MADIFFTSEFILNAIDNKQLIITANNRQRNQIFRAYNGFKRKIQSQSTWSKPRVYTLQQWISLLWQQLIFKDTHAAYFRILDAQQRTLLWEHVIAQSTLSNHLLQPEQMASTADRAMSTLGNWRCQEKTIQATLNNEHQTSTNTTAFLSWLTDFKQHLKNTNFITEEQASEMLITAFENNALPFETQAILYGFDELPPLTEALATCALPNYQSCQPLQYKDNCVQRTNLTTHDKEVKAAALWAAQILNTNSDVNIGIIIPELGQTRAQVERSFFEVFEPLLIDPKVERYTSALNFSAGIPLGQTAIIHTALELLALHTMPFTIERMCTLLYNSLWGYDENTENTLMDADLIFRTALSTKIQSLNKHQINVRELRYQAQRLSETLSDNTCTLHRLLEIAGEISRSQSQTHTLYFWLEQMGLLLKQLGFPGHRRLDSQEHQQLNQWYQLQDSLVRVDQLEIQFTFQEAMTLLKKVSNQTHFQPQTPDCPIQILGALEGAGLNFSHLWVIGLHHQQWPPLPKPNPLLPFNLQLELNMPHASAMRELAYAERLTQGYTSCAKQVVFSYAQAVDDEPVRPSDLIVSIKETSIENLLPGNTNLQSPQQKNYNAVANTQTFEAIDCAYGPALDDYCVKGGASLFKDQSTCPFMAFAKRRLGAIAPMPPNLGFSAIERGNMLHEAMASIWTSVSNKNELFDLASEVLQEKISTSCNAAVNSVQKWRPKELGNKYCTLEKERLAQHINAWLILDLNRDNFTVFAIEQKKEVSFAGLTFELRVDRIDKLSNNTLLIIDYKTGNSSPSSWSTLKLTEPQLPLYACTLSNEVGAIAFVVINAKAQKLLGWGNEDKQLGIQLPETKDWIAQCNNWRDALTHLANEFSAGYAVVDYIDDKSQSYDKALQHLTRILEAEAVVNQVERLKLETSA